MIDSKDKVGIKAEDLRIGNLFDCYGMRIIIDGISPTHVTYSKEGQFLIMDLQPIKLTLDILSKIENFHADNYGIWETVKNNEPYISGCEIEFWMKECEINNVLGWEICFGKDISSVVPIAFIHHLHQLQNLYYSLTNTNLIINNI